MIALQCDLIAMAAQGNNMKCVYMLCFLVAAGRCQKGKQHDSFSQDDAV